MNTIQRNNKTCLIEWIVFVFLLIGFFPAAFGWMIYTLHRDKGNFEINGRLVTIVGWLTIGFGALGVMAAIAVGTEGADGKNLLGAYIIMVAMCLAGGYALIHHGRKYRKFGVLYRKYLPVLQNSEDGSLDSIASICMESYEEVRENLQKMIELGLFPDSYLNVQNRTIVSPLIKVEELRTVECEKCGAVNTFRGTAGKCEYCGSPLEAE